MVKTLLYLAQGAICAAFGGVWASAVLRTRREQVRAGSTPDVVLPSRIQLLIGFVTNFFDTLGIGSFATTTSAFKILRVVPDRVIPGTLLIGHTFPILAEAAIYLTVIDMDVRTLALVVGASVAGAWLGAGVVRGWPKRKIQIGMGVALLGAAVLTVTGLLGLTPAGGEALGLSGVRLWIGILGNFVFGALLTLGIGNYAPSFVLFGLLGMSPRTVFPIVCVSCALVMPLAGIRFVSRGSYSPRAALGLTLGGIPGVLLAAYIVKELPLTVLRWMVVCVIVYAAIALLRSARQERQEERQEKPPERAHEP